MSVVIDKPNFEDKVLTCADCGREFTFAVGEQAYFWDKGLAEPKRCKPCRMSRKRTLVNIAREGSNEHTDTKPG